ncbi:MAG: IPExxxVDY family protein [Bacteroidetes bacterium]|nr:IPExxxVDY family protein [Bacteroidota bacterium]
MAKFTLDIEYDYDFNLIGLCCHARDYKICWSINNYLGFDFTRQDNLKLITKVSTSEFSFFYYEDEDAQQEYSLISNRGTGGLLLPEQKQADYFLKLSGPVSNKQMERLIGKLKELDIIITAFPIEVEHLKSKQNLLLE